jgi:hypothetical protein
MYVASGFACACAAGVWHNPNAARTANNNALTFIFFSKLF